jgi:arylsulfatase A-like enzyme
VPPADRRIARNRYLPHILWHGQWRNGVQAYLASIHYADAMIGRVLDALEKGPNSDNTIVVLWSDHGWHLGEKEHWQKFTAWRACARVPLIIRVPKNAPGLPEGTRPGMVCDSPVSLLDLFATLTGLCGVPAKPDIDSRDIISLLRDPAAESTRPAITHLGRPQDFGISSGSWRYLHYRDGGEELYDIASDPYEWSNLAGDPAHAGQLARLRSLVPENMAPVREAQPGLADFEPAAIVRLVPPGEGTTPASDTPGKEVTLLFQNKRQSAAILCRIDASGKISERTPMRGATQRLVKTPAGQVWLLRDEKGQPLGWHRAGDKPTTIVID